MNPGFKFVSPKGALSLLLLFLLARNIPGQLFVITNDTSGLHNCAILEFNSAGTQVNTIVLTNQSAFALAISGTNLFVAFDQPGVIGKYSTDGATLNPALISGLNNPSAMAISGTNLFVASTDYIGKYTTEGTPLDATLIPNPASGLGVGSYGLAIIGTNLFATYPDNRIAKYTTDGAIVNEMLVTGLSLPSDLMTDGTNLFVANWNGGSPAGWVGEYAVDGSPVAVKLIDDTSGGIQNGPYNLAFDGTYLYLVCNTRGTIGKYTTAGIVVNGSWLTGGHYFMGIAADPSLSPVPPAIGISTLNNQPVVFWPASGTNYILETTTNLASGNWVTVSNYVPVTGAIITNATSPAFFRLR